VKGSNMNPSEKIAVEAVDDDAVLRGDAEDEYRISAEEEAWERQDRLDDLSSDGDWWG
jgi:hypothetical protein